MMARVPYILLLLSLGISVLLVFNIFSPTDRNQTKNRKDWDGCGPCVYEDIDTEVFISGFESTGDSITRIFLHPVGSKNKLDYAVSAHHFKSLDFKLDTSIAKDMTHIYRLKGAKISQGSCAPFLFDNLHLMK